MSGYVRKVEALSSTRGVCDAVAMTDATRGRTRLLRMARIFLAPGIVAGILSAVQLVLTLIEPIGASSYWGLASGILMTWFALSSHRTLRNAANELPSARPEAGSSEQ
jgi:hypothetical protein